VQSAVRTMQARTLQDQTMSQSARFATAMQMSPR
jgi:hypothetical protein